MRRGMVIDLRRCIGCQACVVACKAENATPPGVLWSWVLEKEEGKYPTPRKTFLPMLCNHCKDPACKHVCPSGATTQREDGVVLVDQDKCVGCRACITACPYQARFYRKKFGSYYSNGLTPFEEVGYKRHQPGAVQKCTLCSNRIDQGLEPACVQTCPTNARYFGDLDDPTSQVSRRIRERYAFQLRPEMGTDPSVYYVP